MPDPTPIGPPAESGVGWVDPQNPTPIGPPAESGVGWVDPQNPTPIGPPAESGVGWVNQPDLTPIGPPAESGVGWVATATLTPIGPPAESGVGWVAAPRITSLTPSEAPIAGSAPDGITISGDNLDGTTGVTVDGAPVAFTQVDASTVTFTAPAHAVGPATVALTTPIGTGTATLVYYAPLTVASITPDHGPSTGNTLVTLTGTGFTGTTSVTFDGAPGTTLTVVDDTELTVRTPAGTVGAADVVVTNTRTSSTPVTFTYESVATSISSINPEFGPPSGSTLVTVTGSNLDAVTSVTVGSSSVSFTVVSDTTLTFRTPPHPLGIATIRLSGTGGAATTPFLFANPCRVTGVTPDAGSTLGGTRVTVTGSGFLDATLVEFDLGNPGTSVEVVNDETIEATTPAHSAGTVNVRVTNPRETSPINSPDDNFEFRLAPHITAMSPESGPTTGGTEVTLTGTGLDDVTELRIDTTPVSITSNDGTTITFTTPAHPAGEVWPAVFDATGAAASPLNPFVYYAPLVVTGVTPAVGATAGGTRVTVTGSGFLDATLVEFDLGNPGTSVEVVNDAELTVVSPAHALGPVHIRVTNPRGTSAASSADVFTYVPAPTIDSIDPTSGTARGGTVVTITGEFLTGTTTVLFGDIEGLDLAVVDDFTVTVATPTSEVLGEVPVVVVTPGGESTEEFTFEYTNAPPTCEAAATPTSGEAILTVAFAGTTTDDDDDLPESVLWSFGDGETSDASLVTHSYTTPGIYTATFTVTDRFGATASASVTITVSARPGNQPPVAVATADVTSGDAVLEVNFDGSASYDPDGTIARYLWEFGDGAPAFTPLATHRYRLPGTYVARLTVMDNNGESDVSDTITVTVGAPPTLEPPVITSIRPNVGSVGTPVVIRGLNFLEVTRCEFVPVGDGHGPVADIVHVANDNYMTVIAPSGTDLVNIRVSNADHTSTVGPQTLFQYVMPPTAVGSATPNEGCAPMTVQFSAAGSSSPNGGPLRYLWDFGDGDIFDLGDLDTSVDPNPQHTYWTGGRYAARLSVTDRLGVTATTLVSVNANRCPPGEPEEPVGPEPWPGGPNGGDGGGGGGSGGDPSNPSDPWQYGFDCVLRSQHSVRKFTYRNAEFPPPPDDPPLFSASWSSRRLRSGIQFTVNVTVLRDFPKSTPPGYDWPYPTSVFFGAIAMTAEGVPPALTTAHLGFGSNARLLGASGISLTPRTVGGVFRPLINADEGDEGLRAGQSFALSIVAPPLLEIGYAQVGFQSQYGRAVGDLDVAWIAVDCDIEDTASKSGWVITDPGIASGGAFSVGPVSPQSDLHPRRRKG